MSRLVRFFRSVGATLLAFGILSLTAVPESVAQTTTGSIRGFVTDEAGNGLAGVEVSARAPTTGVQRSTITESNGFYSLPGLQPGRYEFSVRRIGMRTQVRQLDVSVGQVLTLNVQLSEAPIEVEELTVVAEPLYETRTSEVATNVSPSQVENLPQVSRNFLDLAALAPGVRTQGTRLDDTRRTFAAGAQPAEQVNVFVDGASYKNDVLQGGVAGQDASRGNPFPLNAVQEFRVITSNYKAEYQKASSAIITATTKSGTNAWHGSALFHGMGKDFIALDDFAKRNNVPKPDFERYLIGTSVGGPLIQDRLHLFASYEGNYQDRASTVTFGTVTTPPDTVDFSPFEGTFVSPFRSTLFFGKLSYQATPNQTLELSFNSRSESDIRGFGGGTSRQAAEDVQNWVYTGILKHSLFGQSWFNEATVSFQRYRWNPVPLSDNLVGRDYVGIGRIGGRDTRQDFTQDRISFRNDFTFSGFEWSGQHVIKVGTNLDLLNYDVSKEFTGNPVFRYVQDTVGPGPDDDLTYDFPAEARYGTGNPDLSANNAQVGIYVQDDWTPTDRLTLNIGLRWDYESDMLNNDHVTPQAVRDSLRLPIFEDSVLFPIPDRYFTDGDDRPPFLGAFQPRLGFSYALDEGGTTFLFGGFGIFYDRHFYNAALDEKFRRQWKVLLFRFSPDGQPRDGFQTIQWDDQYLSAEGLDQLIASGAAPTPEVFLIDNDTRPPRSNHFSLGVRHLWKGMLFSANYTGIRSNNGLTYIFGNRRPDGTCCYQIPGGSFTNVLLSSDELKTWYDALFFQIEKTYRAEGPWSWGAGFAYTLSWADKIGGDLFSLDFPFVSDYPRHPTSTDERHRVVVNGILEFPYAFRLSGLLTLGSGVPYNIADASQGFGPNEFVFRRNEGRPDTFFFIIPDAWAFRNLDLRLRKSFPVVQGTRLSVVAELFNVFDYQNFGCHDSFIPPEPEVNENFGTPSCVISDGRRLQLGGQFDF